LFDGFEIGLVQASRCELANGLKGRHDGQVFAFVMSRLDGATVDIDGGYVGAGNGDHAARHVLVTAANHHDTIHPLSIDAGLDAVGDDLARDQGVLHALRPHADAIGDGGGAKDLGVGASRLQRGHGRISERLQAAVAGRDGRMAVGDTHHGLVKVLFLVTHGVVHGTVGRTGHPLGDIFGAIVVGHVGQSGRF